MWCEIMNGVILPKTSMAQHSQRKHGPWRTLLTTLNIDDAMRRRHKEGKREIF